VINHDKPPIYNKMDKIQKSIGRMDDSRTTIVSGAGKFFRNIVVEKTAMQTYWILHSMSFKKPPNYREFYSLQYVN
jgi:hypothetical protein